MRTGSMSDDDCVSIIARYLNSYHFMHILRYLLTAVACHHYCLCDLRKCNV